MGLATRKCGGCAEEQDRWRSCSVRGCKHEVCYCDKDGGDTRATDEMEQHIKGHAPQ